MPFTWIVTLIIVNFLSAASMHETPAPPTLRQTKALPEPRSYVCYRSPSPITLDGRLDKPEWKAAPWTEDFADIQGMQMPKPRFRTRAKMLWDEQCLYIGAEMEEPDVWATLTEHDSVIFHDNDFEVFLDPNNTGAPYVELEMNALNTTWDLLLPRPYRGGGPALNGWEIKGLKTAVHIDGLLNNVLHRSNGWSVEIAIPWSSLTEIARVDCPPRDGDQWRIDFSRVEWQTEIRDGKRTKIAGLPEDNWIWSPIGVIDMHRPERWGALQFSSKTEGPVALKPIDGLRERDLLVEIWEAQQAFHREHHRYASSIQELGFENEDVRTEGTKNLFEAQFRLWHVDQSLRFWKG